jgi:HD-like signal output (HDOD) protein
MNNPRQIIEKIRRSPKIPAPSQGVFKVLALTKNPDCDLNDVARVISKDAGLTAQLLRLANSALYGSATPTSSVVQACVRMGIKRVRSIVLNQEIVSGLTKARPDGFDQHRYWQCAFATSVASQDLCMELMPTRSEEAGTAGLLCDLGIGLMALVVHAEYSPVLEELKRGGELHAIEERVLGVTHAQVGAAVLEEWKLEHRIVQAVRDHHLKLAEPPQTDSAKFAAIVAAAVTLADIAMNGTDMDRVAQLFEQVEQLTPKADALVTKLLDSLVEHIQSTAQAYAVELGATDDMKTNLDAVLTEMGSMTTRPAGKIEV